MGTSPTTTLASGTRSMCTGTVLLTFRDRSLFPRTESHSVLLFSCSLILLGACIPVPSDALFSLCLKVWVAYQLSRLKRGDDAGARETLQRSLQSLARHKHVSVISRCVLCRSLVIARFVQFFWHSMVKFQKGNVTCLQTLAATKYCLIVADFGVEFAPMRCLAMGYMRDVAMSFHIPEGLSSAGASESARRSLSRGGAPGVGSTCIAHY